MLALGLYLFLAGFALFLLGLSIFMYFEGRKFGDNQFTVKLLPPPSRPAREAAMEASGRPGESWTPVTGVRIPDISRIPDYAGEAASPAV